MTDPSGVPRSQDEEIVEWYPPDEDKKAYYTFKPLNAPSERYATYMLSPIETGTRVILAKFFPKDEPSIKGINATTKRQLRELKEVCEEKWKETQSK